MSNSNNSEVVETLVSSENLTMRQWYILTNNRDHFTLEEQLAENLSTSDDEQDQVYIGCSLETIHEEYKVLEEKGLVEVTRDVGGQYINLTEKGIYLSFSV